MITIPCFGPSGRCQLTAPCEHACALRVQPELRRTVAAMPFVAAMPLTAQQVVTAIRAVGDEAARRGEMYPQTSDEQREDKLAVRRVVGMLEWYEKNTGCANLKGWPYTQTLP